MEKELMQERLEDDIQSKRGQVYFILKNYPETRSNDGLLICYWLQNFRGVHNFASLKDLAKKNGLSFETIRRARQIIQAAGLFLPDDETVLKRRRLQTIWRDVMTSEQDGERQSHP